MANKNQMQPAGFRSPPATRPTSEFEEDYEEFDNEPVPYIFFQSEFFIFAIYK